MKRLLLALAALCLSIGLSAQNDKAGHIVGIYDYGTGLDACRIRISQLPDGTFQGTVIWVADLYDASGKIKTDVKNPDKSLRNTPLNQVVIFSGLKYNAAKRQWDGAKIYDPERGIRVKMTAKFENSRDLVVRGTVLGIGESVTWIKEE